MHSLTRAEASQQAKHFANLTDCSWMFYELTDRYGKLHCLASPVPFKKWHGCDVRHNRIWETGIGNIEVTVIPPNAP